MKRQNLALGVAAALACFGAGIAAARLFGASSPPPAPAEGPPALPGDAGAPRLDLGLDAGSKAPKLVFDPDAIELLPDASLHLDLPRDFDAGKP